ncbi:MAG: AprI/Inh family metalloprotease inhibitor [Stenotrophomonas sp.]
MATVFPCFGLLALCSLAVPAPTLAQDASIGFGQQSSSTQSSSSSQTTETIRSTTGSSSDDATAKDNGDSAFGNLGSMTTQSNSSGSSHSETRSESKGAGFDIGFHDSSNDDWDNDRHRGGSAVRDSDMFGHWTLGQENGSSCTIELKGSPWFGGYGAWVPAGCPDDFFSANRWLLSGNQLLITNGDNKVIGRFRQSGGGRWSGRRESDGARLYLNPDGR